MEHFVKEAGFSVVEEMGGHGIGREMWESPHVPNYSRRDFERDGDFILEPGLVIAVEPMVNAGTKDMILLPDQWTIVTADGLPSAHFEHTIAITKHGPQILTAGPNGQGWALDA
jgi:methionyl aminopeptidase